MMDCTNYYFEIENNNREEYVDPIAGETLPPLRRYSISKNRPNPIVQMELFIDRDGISFSRCINPGSRNEHLSAIPTEKKITKPIRDTELYEKGSAVLENLENAFGLGMDRLYYEPTYMHKKVGNIIKDNV